MMSLEELKLRGVNVLAKMVIDGEQERFRLMSENGRAGKELSQKLQHQAMEIRSLREMNQSIADENQELRDLCCFLDDERQKFTKLVNEWQKFGTYMSSVMKNEIDTYQHKLSELELRQNSLVSENSELKELLYVANNDMADVRKRGDGSSSSSPSVDKLSSTTTSNENNSLKKNSSGELRASSNNEEAVQYIRCLESRISNLEQENSRLIHTQQPKIEPKSDASLPSDYRKFVLTAEPMYKAGSMPRSAEPKMNKSRSVSSGLTQPDRQFVSGQPSTDRPFISGPPTSDRQFVSGQRPTERYFNSGPPPMERQFISGPPPSDKQFISSIQPNERQYISGPQTADKSFNERHYISGSQSIDRHPHKFSTNRNLPKHDSALNAMKVLSLEDQLDKSRDDTGEVLDDSEKAIIRQMCNVVWRKLGGSVPGYKTAV